MALNKAEKQTYDNVRYFFNHVFERYKQLASLADLKSVRYDTDKSSTNTNYQEEKVLNASYYKDIVDTVKSIVERMQDKRYEDFIKYRFFEHLSIWQISQRL